MDGILVLFIVLRRYNKNTSKIHLFEMNYGR